MLDAIKTFRSASRSSNRLMPSAEATRTRANPLCSLPRKNQMPFIRTAVAQDTSPEQRRAIVMGVHDALVDAIGMPPDELFNLVSDYAPGQFFCSRSFNGIARSERVVVVEITMRRGRSDA